MKKAVRIKAAGGEPQGVSVQPAENIDRWTPDHALRPPADLDALAQLTQATRTRRSCIEAVTLNTVGRGVRVVPREGMEDEADEQEITDLLARLDELARRDTRLGKPSLKRLLGAAKWDEEEVGNGYIEVSRNKVTGEIDGLFHVPGKRVRRRSDRKGWVVGPKNGSGSELVEFYEFGDKVKYDSEGRPEATLNGTGKRWDRNELIAFQIYTSESRDYGLPRDAQLALDYLGDRNAGQANASFFDSSGVPPTIIFVKTPAAENGEEELVVEADPDLPRKITETISSDSHRRHRVAVIPLPEGVEPDKIDLASLSERDMGFIEFRKDNRRATLGAWRLPPIFVADIEDTNYSTAQTERRLGQEQVFEPEQDRWSDILSHSLLRDLGFQHLMFAFEEIDVTDDQAAGESADSLAEHKAITFGEFRKAHGQDPLPEAKPGQEPKEGEVPAGWNDTLVTVAGNGNEAIQRGAEAAARLLAEGKSSGAVGIEAGG